MKPISFMAEWRVSEVAQSCLTRWDPVDCSPPGSSVHGILQARILEWVVISFSRGSSWPRDRTQVSRIVGRFFNVLATRESPLQPGHKPLHTTKAKGPMWASSPLRQSLAQVDRDALCAHPLSGVLTHQPSLQTHQVHMWSLFSR